MSFKKKIIKQDYPGRSDQKYKKCKCLSSKIENEIVHFFVENNYLVKQRIKFGTEINCDDNKKVKVRRRLFFRN